MPIYKSKTSGKIIVTKDTNKIIYTSDSVEPSPCSGYDLCLTSEEGNFIKDGSDLVSQWTDGSVNGNDAIQGNGTYQPLWVSDVDGSPAVLFDGSDDYLYITNNLFKNIWGTNGSTNTDATLEYFFKSPTAPTGYEGTIGYNDISRDNWWFSGIDNGAVFFGVYSGAYRVSLYPSYTIVDDTWYHVAVTRSGNVYTLFIDGVQQATQTTDISSFSLSDMELTIGANRTTFNSYYLDGYLDDIKIIIGENLYPTNFTPPTRT